MTYVLSNLVMVGIYCASGLAAGFLQRYLGAVSVGHGAIIGTGAYVYAILSKNGGTPVLALIGSVIFCIVLSATMLNVFFRVKKEHFPLVTFALQLVWETLILSLDSLTGGARGISAIEESFNLPELLCISLLLMALPAFALYFFAQTPFRAACLVLNRSLELAKTMNISHLPIFVIVSTVYGCVLGICGAIFASKLTVIDPTLFSLEMSISILAISYSVCRLGILGGIAGAAVLIGLPAYIRLLGFSSLDAAYLRVMISGLLLMGFAVYLFSARLRSGTIDSY